LPKTEESDDIDSYFKEMFWDRGIKMTQCHGEVLKEVWFCSLREETIHADGNDPGQKRGFRMPESRKHEASKLASGTQPDHPPSSPWEVNMCPGAGR
jgi:hypothetical protein